MALPEDVVPRSAFHDGLSAENAVEDSFPIDRLVLVTRHNDLRIFLAGTKAAVSTEGGLCHCSVPLPAQAQ